MYFLFQSNTRSAKWLIDYKCRVRLVRLVASSRVCLCNLAPSCRTYDSLFDSLTYWIDVVALFFDRKVGKLTKTTRGVQLVNSDSNSLSPSLALTVKNGQKCRTSHARLVNKENHGLWQCLSGQNVIVSPPNRQIEWLKPGEGSGQVAIYFRCKCFFRCQSVTVDELFNSPVIHEAVQFGTPASRWLLVKNERLNHGRVNVDQVLCVIVEDVSAVLFDQNAPWSILAIVASFDFASCVDVPVALEQNKLLRLAKQTLRLTQLLSL